ncbi:helix-turn-helix domain-containing protein [Pontibacter sp. 13R65]|uniref:helix-turn-helix domain-containing protein n=1 Tax=Pontibacter sp. 13R65 TaxID=3127458 RepID=UPI00301CDF09
MSSFSLHIRNMVCPRCIKVVTDELNGLALPVLKVKLGEAELAQEPNGETLQIIRQVLAKNGFELLEDKKAETVEQIKLAIIHLIHSGRIEELNTNISAYLEESIGKDYNYLSSLFSAEENTTIARYVVLQKVERVKELLLYNELTLSQIAYHLGYSSVAHLSNQFKQITGLTPTEFKNNTSSLRKPIDQVT